MARYPTPMQSFQPFLLPSLWGLWLLYWLIGRLGGKPTERRESARSRLTHMLPLMLGGILLGTPHLLAGHLDARLLPAAPVWLWIGDLLVALGLGFSAAARAWLGANWSSMVTIKTGHELVRSGPYRYVRHPIYTGLLLALFGTVLTFGTERALLGFALMAFGIVCKLTIEERFMAEQFGDAYAHYRAEVPALIPFVI